MQPEEHVAGFFLHDFSLGKERFVKSFASLGLAVTSRCSSVSEGPLTCILGLKYLLI